MGNEAIVKAGLVAICIPSDQREGNQATVHRWLKSVGDPVKKNEPILEINTDKVTLEVVAPVSGRLVEILKSPKQSCELSDIFGRIESGATATESAEGARKSDPEARSGVSHSATVGSLNANSRHSPAVRNLSQRHGVSLEGVSGTGDGGRVTARDVEALAQQSGSKFLPSAADLLVPHTPMRRAIAQEMIKSVTVAPHVTSVFECDFEAVIADRAARKDEYAKRGVRLTMTAYLVRAAAIALKQVPEVNASWHPDHTVQHGAINIGVASAIESAQGGGAGLAVPVVRDAASLDLFGVAQALQRYADAVKASKLASADLSGGTFTISNHGVSGSLFAAPIVILQPQVAILGVGKVEKRLVVSEIAGREVIETRSKAYVTLTIDHRALDGFTANRFLTILTTSLQTPAA